jgi:hypothetical protein
LLSPAARRVAGLYRRVTAHAGRIPLGRKKAPADCRGVGLT